MIFFVFGDMEVAVTKFSYSFYKVKTIRYKNCMNAIFISGERMCPLFFVCFCYSGYFLCSFAF